MKNPFFTNSCMHLLMYVAYIKMSGLCLFILGYSLYACIEEKCNCFITLFKGVLLFK